MQQYNGLLVWQQSVVSAHSCPQRPAPQTSTQVQRCHAHSAATALAPCTTTCIVPQPDYGKTCRTARVAMRRSRSEAASTRRGCRTGAPRCRAPRRLTPRPSGRAPTTGTAWPSTARGTRPAHMRSRPRCGRARRTSFSTSYGRTMARARGTCSTTAPCSTRCQTTTTSWCGTAWLCCVMSKHAVPCEQHSSATSVHNDATATLM